MYNYIFAMHYLSEEVMFSHVVGSSAGLHKNYFPDFHETWMEDESQARIDSSEFWFWSG